MPISAQREWRGSIADDLRPSGMLPITGQSQHEFGGGCGFGWPNEETVNYA
jgi:hypothetical protein